MSTHNICIRREIKILCGYPLLSVAMLNRVFLDCLQNHWILKNLINEQGTVVQSIVSLTSLLMVKMLSVLGSTISN